MVAQEELDAWRASLKHS